MTDRNIEASEGTPATRSGETEIEITGPITLRKICDALDQPPHKVMYHIAALNIKCEYKVGATRVFSEASFLRIKSGIMAIANRKAAAAI